MCGIAGFVSIAPLTGASGVLSRMTTAIARKEEAEAAKERLASSNVESALVRVQR